MAKSYKIWRGNERNKIWDKRLLKLEFTLFQNSSLFFHGVEFVQCLWIVLELNSKTACKRTQHCWPTTLNIVGCYMLRPFAHPVACCWMLLRVVAQSLKPVKFFSQQLPTFLLFRDRRSVAQQCCIRLHNSSNIVGATHGIAHGLQRLMGCILPTMHCRSQHCCELLHPFAHQCQHARSLKDCI